LSIHVQVVDNNRTARLSTAQLLVIAGFDVRAYDSPRSALADLEKGKWDATVTDIENRGMDGFQFLREVKTRSPETEVVLTTAAGFRNKRDRALQEGAYAFLEKPFDIRDLEEVLRRVAKGRGTFGVGRRPVVA
jgi:two-component system C4-dicarboxylate transport response regulator DctD